MPKTGRKAAESECSAARFVQYFHHNVTWGERILLFLSEVRYVSLSNNASVSCFVDLWYTAEGANARPPSLVGTIEVRWRGSVVGSQETKRRLFLEKTSAMEWVRVGYVVSRSFGRTIPIIIAESRCSCFKTTLWHGIE